MNNFEFTCEGVKVWRAYQVGEGNLLLWSKFELEREIGIHEKTINLRPAPSMYTMQVTFCSIMVLKKIIRVMIGK